MRLSRMTQLGVLTIVGWYLLLATLHYCNPRPLWNDEYCIFINIYHRSASQLFSAPLLSFQQFPRVYLYLIGQWAQLFDYRLAALRFFSFVSMIGAFLIWVHLAKKQLKSILGLFTFLLCWIASIPLIYYASELKQYSTDVLVAAVFILFLYSQSKIQEQTSRINYIIILMALPLLGLLSYPAFFFLLLPAYNLWLDIREGKSQAYMLVFYIASVALVLAIVYCFDLRVSRVSWMATATDWNDHMISLASPKLFFKTLGENCDNLTSRWFAELPKWIRMAARVFMAFGFWRMLLGGWQAFKQDGFRLVSIRAIAFVVFCEHFLLGVLKKYPFSVPRTSLFFAPILLFLTVDAFEWIKRKNNAVYICLQCSFLVYLLYIALSITHLSIMGKFQNHSLIVS